MLESSVDREYNILRGLIYGVQVDQISRLDLFRCLDRLYERVLTLEAEASARSAKGGNASLVQGSALTANSTAVFTESVDERSRQKSREYTGGDWRE